MSHKTVKALYFSALFFAWLFTSIESVSAEDFFQAPEYEQSLDLLSASWQTPVYETYSGVSYDNAWTKEPKRPGRNHSFEFGLSKDLFRSRVHAMGIYGVSGILDTTKTKGQPISQSEFTKSTWTIGYHLGAYARTAIKKNYPIELSFGLGNSVTRQTYQNQSSGSLLAYSWVSAITLKAGRTVRLRERLLNIGLFARRMRSSAFQTLGSSGYYSDLSTGDLVAVRNGTNRTDLRINTLHAGVYVSLAIDATKTPEVIETTSPPDNFPGEEDSTPSELPSNWQELIERYQNSRDGAYL